MKNSTIPVFLSGVLLSAMAATSIQAFAQSKENETVVIERKGNSSKKMVIEIDGDEVYIDGKKAKDNDQVKVFKGNGYKQDRNAGGDRAMIQDVSNMAYLGVMTEPDPKGAKVLSVADDSPADDAGLKKGDIIAKVNDDMVNGPAGLQELIRQYKPSETVKLLVWRDGKSMEIKARLAVMQDKSWGSTIPVPMPPFILREPGGMGGGYDMLPYSEGYQSNNNKPRLGFRIQDVEEDNGVRVMGVEPASPASKAGVQEKDLITMVDGKKVKNTDEAREAMKWEDGRKYYNITAIRNGKTVNIEIRLPKQLRSADL